MFSIVQTDAWFVCQCIMLYVFIKFGRPVERNAMKLFEKKLMEIYRTDGDPSKQREKRRKAVDEIVQH